MTIISFKDLDVYQIAYQTAIRVIKEIIPKLPREESYDLASQLRRSAKAIPTFIAEGFAKKNQKKAFQKYLEDALCEANEMIVHLSFCHDLYKKYLYPLDCQEFITIYDRIGKQLYNLKITWKNFSN